MKLSIVVDEGGFVPVRAHRQDAGLDLISPVDIQIQPKSQVLIDTKVHVLIPDGYVGMLTSKSGLMRDFGITSTGTIDAGYTGTIGAVLFNHSYDTVHIKKGQKITQLVIYPIITPEIEVTEELPRTERGWNGFGSTGTEVQHPHIRWEAN